MFGRRLYTGSAPGQFFRLFFWRLRVNCKILNHWVTAALRQPNGIASISGCHWGAGVIPKYSSDTLGTSEQAEWIAGMLSPFFFALVENKAENRWPRDSFFCFFWFWDQHFFSATTVAYQLENTFCPSTETSARLSYNSATALPEDAR